MAIATIIKILGWIFFLFPIIAFIGISAFAIYKIASNDDDLIMGFIMIAFTIFVLGAIMLAVSYFTDAFAFLA